MKNQSNMIQTPISTENNFIIPIDEEDGRKHNFDAPVHPLKIKEDQNP